jgi:hypothetical protein
MAITSFSRHATAAFAVIALLICGAAIAAPVSAATKYLGGSPSFSVSVTGANEFTPGEDATINVLVKNSGVNTIKQLDLGTIDYEDLPTTAKYVTLTLVSGSDAITIKSDPQMVGSIPSGGIGTTVQFKAKISANATTGEYQLPLTLEYRYPNDIRQEKADVFEYSYTPVTETIPVTIRIKPEMKIAVLEAVPDTMAAGTEGYLRLTLKNIGPEDGTKATAKLIGGGSGNSGIVPTDSTAYIGDFPSSGTVNCTFKIVASKDATSQTYPVGVSVTYTNREGDIVNTDTEIIGVPVYAKTSFAVTSPVPSITAGTHATVDVTYRNNGVLAVYEAQSRITPHGLVTSDNNLAYLGTINPGESVTARYELQADSAAEPGEYAFDSTIRYRDAMGNSQESDTVSVTVTILPAQAGTIAGLPAGTVAAVIVVLVIAAAIGLFAYRRRKSMQ